MNVPGEFACPKCNQRIAVGTPNCPRCGQPFAWNQVPQAAEPKYVAPSHPNHRGWILPLGIICALALAFLGLNALGVFKSLMPDRGSNLKVEVAKPQPVLPVISPEANAVLESSGMPPEIADWLKHLQAVEAKREKLANQQITEAMGVLFMVQKQKILGSMMEDDVTLPSETAAIETEKFKVAWEQLLVDFKGKAPPEECVKIAETYELVIINVGEATNEILARLDFAVKNPEEGTKVISELSAMMGKSSETIGKPASETDALVQEICNRYKVVKWFSIASDYGSGLGGMLGGGGIGGLIPGL